MPAKRRKTGPTAKAAAAVTTRATIRALERRVKRLERELEAAKTREERRVELVRRAANRRLATMMQEIATLRHHEARAGALERLLAARDAPVRSEGTADGEDSRLPG
jgi:hypothetical protein